MPPSLSSKPEYNPVLSEVLKCFLTLSSARQFGFGVYQPILFSEINSYFNLYGKPTGMSLDDFICLVKYADYVFLKEVNKKK